MVADWLNICFHMQNYQDWHKTNVKDVRLEDGAAASSSVVSHFQVPTQVQSESRPDKLVEGFLQQFKSHSQTHHRLHARHV